MGAPTRGIFGVSTLMLVVPVLTALYALLFYYQPAVLLLLLSCFLLALAVPGPVRLLYAGIVGFKLCILAVASLLASLLFRDAIIPGQPDQFWYIETASVIAYEIADTGWGTDYFAIVGLHNRLYNVVLGWLTFANYSPDLVLFRLLNVFASLVLIVFGIRLADALYGPDRTLRVTCALGLAVLPFTNLYSMIVTRDVLIAACVMAFMYGMVRRSLAIQAAVFAIMFYLRIQFAFVLLVIAVGWLVMNHSHFSRLGRKRLIWTGLGIVIVGGASWVVANLVPQLRHVTAVLGPAFLLEFASAFPISFLGLDFLFADASKTNLPRIQLLLGRVIAPETIILPALLIYTTLRSSRLGLPVIHRRFLLVLWIAIGIYAFGYYVEYRLMFVRLLLPFYPLMYIAVLPVFLRAIARIRGGLRARMAYA